MSHLSKKRSRIDWIYDFTVSNNGIIIAMLVFQIVYTILKLGQSPKDSKTLGLFHTSNKMIIVSLGLSFILISTTVISFVRRLLLEFISKMIKPRKWLPFLLGSRTIRIENPRKLHMFFGLMFTFWSTVHTITALMLFYVDNRFNLKKKRNPHQPISIDVPMLVTGIVIMALLLPLVLTSIPLIRRKFFELFYYTHYLFIFIVITSFVHASSQTFWIVSIGIYVVNKVLNFLSIKKYKHDEIKVEIVSNNITKLQFPNRFIKSSLDIVDMGSVAPSQYLYVCCPQLSIFQWHPFDISDSQSPNSPYTTLIISTQGSWTQKLYSLMLESQSIQSNSPNTVVQSNQSNQIPLEFTLLTSRRFATPLSYIFENNVAILIAGGVGISPVLSIIRAHLDNKNEKHKSYHLKYIHVVWIHRSAKQLDLLKDFLNSLDPEDNLDFVSFSLYYTSMHDIASYEKSFTCQNFPNLQIPIEYGKPDLFAVYRTIISYYKSNTKIGISAIGSEILTKHAKRMAVKWRLHNIFRFNVGYYKATL
ncbi:hypothetical protein BB560_005755 [Smittium megazygosporum]|uniref:FAD-binding FR-type domain-containing protein n=1 Tax=Smittium megazygosporum TaxID=133381 RepID=A0A2T9YY13_9FUNG|nr:hypothetical protein BB560_005755 [Smittium megazygosporum]